MLTGAIVGAIAGIIGIVIVYFMREQRFNKVLSSIKSPEMEYAALYNYCMANRYKKGVKYYDSYGVLYIIGKNAYYKPKADATPLAFNLTECTVQQEADWRLLKWFSITTPSGEKHYFNSNKMGAFKANSDETLKGLAELKSRKGA